MTTPWGGHPSATLANVQSGLGWVHNSVMLEGIEKCVMRAPLKPMPKPIYFPSHKTLDQVGRRLVEFEAAPSWLKVPGHRRRGAERLSRGHGRTDGNRGSRRDGRPLAARSGATRSIARLPRRSSLAFEAFERDPEARVAVLWGEGGDFCAGADLVAIAEGRPNRIERDGPGPMGPTRMVLTKPVIAAVAGHAVAGGLELALWCDLRVVEEGATFGVYCRRWGVPLIDGGTVRLPRIVGAGARARHGPHGPARACPGGARVGPRQSSRSPRARARRGRGARRRNRALPAAMHAVRPAQLDRAMVPAARGAALATSSSSGRATIASGETRRRSDAFCRRSGPPRRKSVGNLCYRVRARSRMVRG